MPSAKRTCLEEKSVDTNICVYVYTYADMYAYTYTHLLKCMHEYNKSTYIDIQVGCTLCKHPHTIHACASVRHLKSAIFWAALQRLLLGPRRQDGNEIRHGGSADYGSRFVVLATRLWPWFQTV